MSVKSDSAATRSARRSAFVAAGSLVVSGIALAAMFFPFLFNRWISRDDGGVFVFALREFLNHHGSLYSTVWSDMYGPFYYLTMSTVYRVIHQQPTLENGRWIVLVLTTMSAALFGGSVWRVTKNLPCSLVCETATFLLLVQIAGNEPMHPGSLGVFLVAVVAFEISSYAVTRRTAHLVGIGAATGALVMTKVNAGGLVAAAVVFALVVGSEQISRRIQAVIGGLVALLPIVLVAQNIEQTWAAIFAIVVVFSIVGMFVVMSVDQLTLPRWSLVPTAAGAAVAFIVSLAFPLFSGTPIRGEIRGVFIRPLTLPGAFTLPANVKLEWFTVMLTLAGISAALVWRSLSKETVRAVSGGIHPTLAALALWMLGLGITVFASGGVVARWLPAIVLLPALAFCANSSEAIRFALRSTVLLAILQVLVIYPVAGSQIGWGTVAMVVPCAIALAAGVDHSQFWRESGVLVRGGAAAFLCLAILIASYAWPPDLWKAYLDASPVRLPGAGLIRIDPHVARTLRKVTAALRAQCDTFYGVPDQNSFYIFSGLPAVTAMVANGSTSGLTTAQQGQVIRALQAKTTANERVCILRDSSQGVVLPKGLLTDTLNQYTRVVATVGTFTIARHN